MDDSLDCTFGGGHTHSYGFSICPLNSRTDIEIRKTMDDWIECHAETFFLGN